MRVPEHMREKLREDAQFRVAENYLLSGLGRHAPDEDVDLAVRSLFALSVQLGDKPYLMGDDAMRHRCHRLRRAGRNPDAVLRLRRCASGPRNSKISRPMSTG